jgi:hypothetical protein
MLLEEMKEYYKTYQKMNRVLELSTTTYQDWRRKGGIPLKTQLLIERKTNGRFVADEKHDPVLSKELV